MANAQTRLREHLEKLYADAICAAADSAGLPFHRRTSRALAPRSAR